MSITTAAAALPAIEVPGRPFAQVERDLHAMGGSFDQMRKAGQRLFLFLWQATGFGKDEVRLTDREIAEQCERCPRWVQKGLKQLLGHGLILGQDPDAETDPKIAKHFEKGPRNVAGRILEITLEFAKPKAKDDPEPKGKSKGKTKAIAPKAPARLRRPARQ